MKKFFTLLAAVVLIFAAGCGADKGITSEEFMNRYNANLAALNLGRNGDNFKIRSFKVDKEGKIFFTGINPDLSPACGAIIAILDSNSKEIRELNFIVDLNRPVSREMTGADSFMFFAAIVSYSLDSDKIISQADSVERIKFLQDLIPENVSASKNSTSEKSFNGNLYTLTLTPDSKALLEIEIK